MFRGAAAAVLLLVRSPSADDSLVLHQSLSGPLHHPHHLHQCDHHEPGALQPTTGERHRHVTRSQSAVCTLASIDWSGAGVILVSLDI